MFNVTGSELIFLLLAGLMVLGPDRLPGVMRRAGRLYGELRRMANGYEREFRDTFAEPITEFRKAANEIRTEFTREVAEFGKVDTEPSPPMRPEKAGAVPAPAGEVPAPAETPESNEAPESDGATELSAPSDKDES